MSTCTDFSDMEQLLQAIESLEINSKYDTTKLDSEANEGYLKTFRRRVGALFKCAMRVKFGAKPSSFLDKALEKTSVKALYIDGRVGNDFVVVKNRGVWRVGKIYLPDNKIASEASFSPKHIDEFEYDEIKGHSVPNWIESLDITKDELESIRNAVLEMIYLEQHPEGANAEEYVYSLEE